MWERRISHEGLKVYRVVKGQNSEDVRIKAEMQLAKWEELWRKKQIAVGQLRLKAVEKEIRESQKAEAAERMQEAQAAIEALGKILSDSLGLDHRIQWETKKQLAEFPATKPLMPEARLIPERPRRGDAKFQVRLGLLDKFWPSRREAKLMQAEKAFQSAEAAWSELAERARAENLHASQEHKARVKEWETSKEVFEQKRSEFNAGIEFLKKGYFSCEPECLDFYWEDILSHSGYLEGFPRETKLEYIVETQTLVVDYELPPISALPKIKEVKYNSAKQEIQEVLVSEAWLNKTYDDVIYEICLRTLYCLFQSDEAAALKNIVFNGWVHSIDKATGSEVHPCILSLQAEKSEFLALELSRVDLKACFKKLKGVSGSRLADLSAVRPILQLNRDDKRFVPSYGVIDGVDDRTNLAAMDWLDFENLIREIFEKEFSKNGGEVKITQASRDGGVDAIAFDPDPIRGGKIVIQAKRYTNVVGVSAVRDLYGTVHNEGATKGILVTTANYGPDAYEFARGKPLTLLSGSELLYLLEKHGHRAKIDLPEARRIAAERESESGKT